MNPISEVIQNLNNCFTTPLYSNSIAEKDYGLVLNNIGGEPHKAVFSTNQKINLILKSHNH
jgi:hypothetical protein